MAKKDIEDKEKTTTGLLIGDFVPPLKEILIPILRSRFSHY